MSPERRARKVAYMRQYWADNREVLRARKRAAYHGDVVLSRTKQAQRRETLEWKQYVADSRFRKALWSARKNATVQNHQPCNATEQQIKEAFTGNCYLCGQKESSLTRRLHLDHCHNTGRFRGWLCSNCNTALGLLKDSLELVAKLTGYLKG